MPRRAAWRTVLSDVDATPAGTARDLGVLPRRDGHAGFTVELLKLLEHHSARRHVDAECKRFGGEDSFDELLLEQLFDDLFECRKQAGMVSCHATLEAIEPLPVAENGEIVVE